MTITPTLFEALLKCPTKCWLRAAGEAPSGNPYAEWVQSQNGSYRATHGKKARSFRGASAPLLAPGLHHRFLLRDTTLRGQRRYFGPPGSRREGSEPECPRSERGGGGAAGNAGSGDPAYKATRPLL